MSDHDHDDHTHDEPAPVIISPDQHHINALREEVRRSHERAYDLTLEITGLRANNSWLQSVIAQLQQQLLEQSA